MSLSHVVPFGPGFSGCNEWYQEDSKSFWIVTGLGELLPDDSGVAGDGEREAVAVADDEDMLLDTVMGEEDDKRPGVNYVGGKDTCISLDSHGEHVIGGALVLAFPTSNTMKRGAENQLSKDADDLENEVRSFWTSILHNSQVLPFQDQSEPGQGFRKADESVLAGRQSVVPHSYRCVLTRS